MSKVLQAHASIAALLTTQTINTPTDIARAGGMVTVAMATWYPPKHRHVVTDGLAALKATVESSRTTGKTKFAQEIADAMKSIAAQPAEPPVQPNGGAHQSAQSGQHRDQRPGAGGGH